MFLSFLVLTVDEDHMIYIYTYIFIIWDDNGENNPTLGIK